MKYFPLIAISWFAELVVTRPFEAYPVSVPYYVALG
jgi:hypothetical protein